MLHGAASPEKGSVQKSLCRTWAKRWRARRDLSLAAETSAYTLSTSKVDTRLPGKGNSNSHGARLAHLIITMMNWIRTSRLSITNSLSLQGAPLLDGRESRLRQASGIVCFSSLLLLSLELSDTKVYESQIRALLGSASHFCEAVVLKLRTVLHC